MTMRQINLIEGQSKISPAPFVERRYGALSGANGHGSVLKQIRGCARGRQLLMARPRGASVELRSSCRKLRRSRRRAIRPAGCQPLGGIAIATVIETSRMPGSSGIDDAEPWLVERRSISIRSMRKSRYHSGPRLRWARPDDHRMWSRNLTASILIAPLLAGGCSRAALPLPPTSQESAALDKYEECMRDMRGDVFAERTCEAYLDSAQRP
jgi:hypothetical protein